MRPTKTSNIPHSTSNGGARVASSSATRHPTLPSGNCSSCRPPDSAQTHVLVPLGPGGLASGCSRQPGSPSLHLRNHAEEQRAEEKPWRHDQVDMHVDACRGSRIRQRWRRMAGREREIPEQGSVYCMHTRSRTRLHLDLCASVRMEHAS